MLLVWFSRYRQTPTILIQVNTHAIAQASTTYASRIVFFNLAISENLEYESTLYVIMSFYPFYTIGNIC